MVTVAQLAQWLHISMSFVQWLLQIRVGPSELPNRISEVESFSSVEASFGDVPHFLFVWKSL